jgi:hypothetical protein
MIFTYVDNSNVSIEGKRVSAIKKGYAADLYDSFQNEIFDQEWQLDYGFLHGIACGDKKNIRSAKLWGSPPPYDTFWNMVRSKGFEVKTYEKSFGHEKKVDTAIAHAMTKDAYTILNKAEDEIILVAGDKDYVPIVEDLRQFGVNFTVMFWEHAAREIREIATTFISLNPYFDLITFKKE